ncbi:MAG: glycosyltransferase [Bacteroidales bacterium]|nr:glycosyltransferase [Bacteroidales bacterium]
MSAKKPCLHYVSNFLPLTMVWIYNILENLQEYDPYVLARKKINRKSFPFEKIKALDDLSLGKQLYHIGISKITRVIPFFLKAAQQIRPDIVHFHLGNIAYKSLPLKRKLAIPGVLSFYGADAYLYPERKRNRRRLSVVYRDMDKILVLGPAMQNQMKLLGCPENKLEIFHLGIDVDKNPFTEKIFPQNRPLKFLLASNFVEKKGMDITLYALEQIKKHIDFEIEIIGDGTLRPDILNIIRKTGLEDRTKLHGYKPYTFVLEKACECDVFLQASRTASNGDKEGTPMVFVDVMAAGMPVISTYHSDIPEIVREGFNGYLAEENNIDSFAACLLKLIENKSDFHSLSVNSRSHVKEHFNIFVQAKRLESIYNKLHYFR